MVFGFWLYKIFGNIYLIPITLIFDVDHFLGFIYDYATRKIPKLTKWQHLFYRPRTWLHSFIGLFLLAVPSSYFAPLYMVVIALAAHLAMDGIDKMGFEVMPFLSDKRISGPIPIVFSGKKLQSSENQKKFHFISFVFIAVMLVLIGLSSL